MMSMRARSIFVVGGAALVVALAAACSSSSDDGAEIAGRSAAALSFSSGDNDGYCASNPSAQCWHGTPVAAKQIVLTFDDGPGSQTLVLSSFLKSRGIRATFFVNGQNLGGGTSVLSQLVADGHLVGNHTQHHYDLTSLDDGAIMRELSDTDAIIAPFVPSGHFVFRAPFGAWSAHDYSVLHGSSMDKYAGPVKWDVGGAMTSIYGADWDCWQNIDGWGVMTTKQCGDRYMREIVDVGRGIVLMHDADYGDSSNHSLTSGKGNTVDMVKYLVDGNAALGVTGLKARGYTFLRLDEVPDIAAAFGAPPPPPPPPPPPEDGGTCSFNPTWAQTSYADEWWVEYTISGATIASAYLEVPGLGNVTLSSRYGKWVGGSSFRIPTGTQVVVHATASGGATAQTKPFGYLVVTNPVTSCSGGGGGTDAGGGTDGGGGTCTFVPTWGQTSYANEWWVEYTISGSVASAYLEVVGGQTVPLSMQWSKWTGGPTARIPTGTSVVVHATSTNGESAKTVPFGYLVVKNPGTAPCGQ